MSTMPSLCGIVDTSEGLKHPRQELYQLLCLKSPAVSFKKENILLNNTWNLPSKTTVFVEYFDVKYFSLINLNFS